MEEIGFDGMLHCLGICVTLAWPGATSAYFGAPLPPAVSIVVAALPQDPPPQDPPKQPTRRALLVGIDKYPPENRWPRLSGPTADVAALQSVLVERAGFRASDVSTLLDEHATADAIRHGFAAMIDASAANDLILFYFAGHGSQLPDDSGEELDGLDETLVPYDATALRGQWKDVRDDEIGELIARANQKTDQVVLILDCCSSGTNTRAADSRGRRFLEPTSRGLDAPRVSAHARAVPETGSGYVPPALKYVAFAACRADQSAYEIQVDAPDAPGEKRARGVFSYYLVDALRTLPPGASYADLMVQVDSRVSRNQAEQTPILEGSLAGYVIFEPFAAVHTPRFTLEVSEDGALTLSGGRLQGLSAGAVFSVCAADAAQDSLSERLGRARLTRLGPMQSVAEWIEAGEAARAEGKRTAFLLERGAPDVAMPITVESDGESEARQEMVRTFDATGIVSCGPPDQAEITLRRVGARWMAFAKDHTELPMSADAGSKEQVDALIRDVTRLAAAYRIDQLLRQETTSSLDIDCCLKRVGKDNQLLGVIQPDDDGRMRLARGTQWAFCARNRSDVPVYVNVVVLSPDGQIELLKPPTLDDLLPPGREMVKPALSIVIPPGLESFYRGGSLRLHCIATPRLLDLSSLEQGPVSCGRSARGIEEAPSAKRDPLTCESWCGKRIEIWAKP